MTEDNKRSNRVHRTNVVKETSPIPEARILADPFTGRKLHVFRSRTRSGNPFGWRRKADMMELHSAASYKPRGMPTENIAMVHSLASDIVEVQVTLNMAEGPTVSLPDGSITLAMVNSSPAFMVLVRILHFADGQINVLGYQSHQQQRWNRAGGYLECSRLSSIFACIVFYSRCNFSTLPHVIIL